jgi:peptide deformylase
MIITDESLLRVECDDIRLEDIATVREKLETELEASAKRGMPGIGLAAPQIGIPLKMAIIRLNGTNIDLVNAKIVKAYDKSLFEGEGCLSYPGKVAKTFRFREIHVENHGIESHSFIATGLLSVAIQHELDHLQGVLLPDVMIAEPKTKTKIRPNDRCPCNSGKKYKKCCGK